MQFGHFIQTTGAQSASLPARTALNADFGDAQALQVWLSIFDMKSPGTARHYRTQTGKFLLFLRLLHPDWVANSHLKQASENDVSLYELALAHTPLPNGRSPNLRLSSDELVLEGLDKQPFAKALKKSSVNQALSVLNALYEYLRTPNGVMTEPYVFINPVTRVRKSATRNVLQIERHIPIEGVKAMRDYLHATIDHANAVGDKAAVMRYERKLWMFTLLFGLWGRREEICNLTMGDFTQQHDGAWKVALVRKGNKEQSLPVAKWVIDGLYRYRKSLSQPLYWDAGDRSPAIWGIRIKPPSRGKTRQTMPLQSGKPIGAQALYNEIKSLAQETADELERDVMSFNVETDRRPLIVKLLRQCSPHWFRHTGPTIAINSGAMSIENASKMLGHSTLDTTSKMYYHADDEKTRVGLDSLGSALSGN